MNLLSSFNDFYKTLEGNSLFFFWIVVFLFFFFIFLLIILIVKNKKLTKLLKEEQNLITPSEEKEEVIPVIEIKEKEKEIDNSVIERIEPKIEIKEERIKPVIEKPKEETGLYKKNVLREISARQTSPIHIDNHDDIDNKNNIEDTSDFYDLDSPYLREDSVSPLEEMEDAYEVNDNMKFAHDIVSKMEEEVKPSNIELTDYEKKQEEEAIISYDELLKVKDKIYNITEDEENEDFIDELKSFRLDL